MEVVAYEEPSSWDDCGMDWNNPDPRNAAYAMAIRSALAERCVASGQSMPLAALKICPWKPVSVASLAAVVSSINSICTNFLNADFDYENSPEEFPRKWTYRDLVAAEGCGLYAFATPGDLCAGGGSWMKAIRNALDKLTVVPCKKVWYERRSASSTGQYSFTASETVDEAVSNAVEKFASATARNVSGGTLNGYSVNSWSSVIDGTRIYSYPSDSDEPLIRPYYRGEASASSIRVTRALPPITGREADFKLFYRATAPTVSKWNSVQLESSDFDADGSKAGDEKIKDGVNCVCEHFSYETELDIPFGADSAIPAVDKIPTSDFDENGSAVQLRKAMRGWVAQVWAYADFDCEGGFRFRPGGQ